MVVWAPSQAGFDTAMTNLKSVKVFGSKSCKGNHVEQLIARVILTLKMNPVNIHQVWNFRVGKEAWLLKKDYVPAMTHYLGSYPWEGIHNRRDVDAAIWPDIRTWWEFADKVIASSGDNWFYKI